MPAEKEHVFEAKEAIISGLQSGDPGWAGLKSEGFDPDALWDRVDQDVELLRDLIAVFEEEFPSMLKNLEAAIENGDASGVERAGHKIKGSVLQFSGRGAAAAAFELEQLGRSGTVAGARAPLEKLKQETDILVKSLHAMTDGMAQ